MRRCVAVGAAVVHVDMNVAAPPATPRQVVDAFENDAACDTSTRRHVHVGTINPILGSAPNLEMNRSRSHSELGRPAGMEIRVFELPLGTVERLIRVAPRIVRRITT